MSRRSVVSSLSSSGSSSSRESAPATRGGDSGGVWSVLSSFMSSLRSPNEAASSKGGPNSGNSQRDHSRTGGSNDAQRHHTRGARANQQGQTQAHHEHAKQRGSGAQSSSLHAHNRAGVGGSSSSSGGRPASATSDHDHHHNAANAITNTNTAQHKHKNYNQHAHMGGNVLTHQPLHATSDLSPGSRVLSLVGPSAQRTNAAAAKPTQTHTHSANAHTNANATSTNLRAAHHQQSPPTHALSSSASSSSSSPGSTRQGANGVIRSPQLLAGARPAQRAKTEQLQQDGGDSDSSGTPSVPALPSHGHNVSKHHHGGSGGDAMHTEPTTLKQSKHHQDQQTAQDDMDKEQQKGRGAKRKVDRNPQADSDDPNHSGTRSKPQASTKAQHGDDSTHKRMKRPSVDYSGSVPGEIHVGEDAPAHAAGHRFANALAPPHHSAGQRHPAPLPSPLLSVMTPSSSGGLTPVSVGSLDAVNRPAVRRASKGAPKEPLNARYFFKPFPIHVPNTTHLLTQPPQTTNSSSRKKTSKDDTATVAVAATAAAAAAAEIDPSKPLLSFFRSGRYLDSVPQVFGNRLYTTLLPPHTIDAPTPAATASANADSADGGTGSSAGGSTARVLRQSSRYAQVFQRRSDDSKKSSPPRKSIEREGSPGAGDDGAEAKKSTKEKKEEKKSIGKGAGNSAAAAPVMPTAGQVRADAASVSWISRVDLRHGDVGTRVRSYLAVLDADEDNVTIVVRQRYEADITRPRTARRKGGRQRVPHAADDQSVPNSGNGSAAGDGGGKKGRKRSASVDEEADESSVAEEEQTAKAAILAFIARAKAGSIGSSVPPCAGMLQSLLPPAAAAQAKAAADAAAQVGDVPTNRTSNEPSPLQLVCAAILRVLWLHPSSSPFIDPVDPYALHIFNYFSIIRQPLAMRDVDRRIRANYYVTLVEFLNDLAHMLDCCIMYNERDAPIVHDAMKLNSALMRSLNALVDELRAAGAASKLVIPSHISIAALEAWMVWKGVRSVISTQLVFCAKAEAHNALIKRHSRNIPPAVARRLARRGGIVSNNWLVSPDTSSDDGDASSSSATSMVSHSSGHDRWYQMCRLDRQGDAEDYVRAAHARSIVSLTDIETILSKIHAVKNNWRRRL